VEKARLGRYAAQIAAAFELRELLDFGVADFIDGLGEQLPT